MQLINEDFESKFEYLTPAILKAIRKKIEFDPIGDLTTSEKKEYEQLVLDFVKTFLKEADPTPKNKFYVYLWNFMRKELFPNFHLYSLKNELWKKNFFKDQVPRIKEILSSLALVMEKSDFKKEYPDILTKSPWQILNTIEEFGGIVKQKDTIKKLSKDPAKHVNYGEYTLFLLDNVEDLVAMSFKTGWCTNQKSQATRYTTRTRTKIENNKKKYENVEDVKNEIIKNLISKIELNLDNFAQKSKYWDKYLKWITQNKDVALNIVRSEVDDSEQNFELQILKRGVKIWSSFRSKNINKKTFSIDYLNELIKNNNDTYFLIFAYAGLGSWLTRQWAFLIVQDFAKKHEDKINKISNNKYQMHSKAREFVPNDQLFMLYDRENPVFLIDPYTGQFRQKLNRDWRPNSMIKLLQEMFAKMYDQINSVTLKSFINKASLPEDELEAYFGTSRDEWNCVALLIPQLWPAVKNKIGKDEPEVLEMRMSVISDKKFVNDFFKNSLKLYYNRNSHRKTQEDLFGEIDYAKNMDLNELYDWWFQNYEKRYTPLEEKILNEKNFFILKIYLEALYEKTQERIPEFEEILKKNGKYPLRIMNIDPNEEEDINKNQYLLNLNVNEEGYLNLEKELLNNIKESLEYVRSINSRIPLFEKFYKTNIEFVNEYCKIFDSLKTLNLNKFETSSSNDFKNAIVISENQMNELCKLYNYDKQHLIMEIKNRGYDGIFIGKNIIDLRNDSIFKKFSKLNEDNFDEYQIKMHDNLCEKLWENKSLKKNVRVALLKIAKKFLESLDIEETIYIKDITFTGSLVNYNYTDYSDIDLHIIVDVKGDNTLKQLLQSKKTIWNSKHDIEIYGHDVEVYPQPSDLEHFSSGVYSLLKNEWISEPKRDRDAIDMDLVNEKVQNWIDLIEGAVESNQMSDVDDKISNARQAGLEKGGEYSIENLAFKVLRNMGYIDKMKDEKTSQTDEELSIVEKRLNSLLERRGSPKGRRKTNQPSYREMQKDLEEKGTEDIFAEPQETETSEWRNKELAGDALEDAPSQEQTEEKPTEVDPKGIQKDPEPEEIQAKIKKLLMPDIDKLAKFLTFGSSEYKKAAERIWEPILFSLNVSIGKEKKVKREAFGVDAPMLKGLADIVGLSIKPLTNALADLFNNIWNKILEKLKSSSDRRIITKTIKILKESKKNARQTFEELSVKAREEFTNVGKQDEYHQAFEKIDTMITAWEYNVEKRISELENKSEDEMINVPFGKEGIESAGEDARIRWIALRASFDRAKGNIDPQAQRSIERDIFNIEREAEKMGIDLNDRWSYHRSASRFIRMFNKVKQKINQETQRPKE